MPAAKRPMIPVVKDGATATFRRTVGGPSNRAGHDLRTRGECWGATSTDGRWRFDRLDAPGTPWQVTYQPDGDHRHVYQWTFSSLNRARAWAHSTVERVNAEQSVEAAS